MQSEDGQTKRRARRRREERKVGSKGKEGYDANGRGMKVRGTGAVTVLSVFLWALKIFKLKKKE